MNSIEQRLQSSSNMDTGWAWFALAASLVSNIIVDGIIYASGQAFYPVWMSSFNVGAGIAVTPIAFFVGIYFIGGPFAGSIAEKHGCKYLGKIGCALSVFGLLCSAMATGVVGLCVTLGLFTGFGFCMLYVASIAVINEYFELKRTFAKGLVISGSGIGTFIFAPFIQSMAVTLGWRESMAILAVILLLTFATALMYEPVTLQNIKNYPSDVSNSFRNTVNMIKRISSDIKDRKFFLRFKRKSDSTEKDECTVDAVCKGKKKKKRIFQFKLLKSPTFVLFCFSTYFTLMGLLVPYIFLPQQSLTRGSSVTDATILVSLLGVFNVISRLSCTFLIIRRSRDPTVMSSICLMIAGFFTILVPTFYDYWLFVLFTMIFSVGTGTFAALRSEMCRIHCGQRRLKSGWSLLMLFMGLGIMIGVPLGGALYDVTGDYSTSFYVSGLLILFSGIMSWSLEKMKEWEISKLLDKYSKERCVKHTDIEEGSDEREDDGEKEEHTDSCSFKSLPDASKDFDAVPKVKPLKAQTKLKDMKVLYKKENAGIQKILTPTDRISPMSERLQKMEREDPQKLLAMVAGPEEATKADTLRGQITRGVLKKSKSPRVNDTALLHDKQQPRYLYPNEDIKLEKSGATGGYCKSPSGTSDGKNKKIFGSDRKGLQFWKGLSSSSLANDKGLTRDNRELDSTKSQSIKESSSSSTSRRFYKSPESREAESALNVNQCGHEADDTGKAIDRQFEMKQKYLRLNKSKSPAMKLPGVEPLKPFGPVESDQTATKGWDDSKSEQGSDSKRKPGGQGGPESPYIKLLSHWFKGKHSFRDPDKGSKSPSKRRKTPKKSGGSGRAARKLHVMQLRKTPGLATNSFLSTSKSVFCGLNRSAQKPSEIMRTPETSGESISQKRFDSNKEMKETSKKDSRPNKGYTCSRI